jgi:transketolase
VRTTIGYGSPKKAGTSSAHGSPLGADEVAAAKRALGWDPEASFHVPDEVRAHCAAIGARGAAARADWEQRFAAWRVAFPELAESYDLAARGELPAGWADALPSWKAGDAVATRVASGKCMVHLAARIPWLLGGDADLGGSTKTIVPGGDWSIAGGRNLRFGIREHAMGAIVNGLAYHGGVRGFAATFFVFSDYMRPAVRLAALNHLPATYVWTHDSIGVGEDGPTHQPVEHLMALRAMPNLWVIRPCDGNETAAAWRVAMARTDGPVALVLSRQDLAVVSSAPPVERGGYVLRDSEAAPQVILLATGSEVGLAVAAYERLTAEGIAARVVSLPCWQAFVAQPPSYPRSGAAADGAGPGRGRGRGQLWVGAIWSGSTAGWSASNRYGRVGARRGADGEARPHGRRGGRRGPARPWRSPSPLRERTGGAAGSLHRDRARGRRHRDLLPFTLPTSLSV